MGPSYQRRGVLVGTIGVDNVTFRFPGSAMFLHSACSAASSWPNLLLFALLFAVTVLLVPTNASAADLDQARSSYATGQYEAAAELANEAIAAGTWNYRWPLLLIETQLTLGRYDEALQTFEQANQRFSTSLPIQTVGIEVLRCNSLGEQALVQRSLVFELLRTSPARYSGSDNLIAAGRYFAGRGEDGRKVLELFYDQVLNRDPAFTEAHIATAELALSKSDFAVAAKSLDAAARLEPLNPQIALLAARAWEPSDAVRSETELSRALDLNPRHVPSLLMRADEAVAREFYDSADQWLDKVEQVNPKLPKLWAYRAVLAELRGDSETSATHRQRALEPWPDNPEVDFLIGRELSEKYRFAEGAEAQRRALQMDPSYNDARFELAQNLLRLGEDETGWELAEWAQREDAYNVVAYNLLNLRDRLRKFKVLRRGELLVRMESREADIYGPAVLDLLTEAQTVLCDKYQVQPDGPVVVEIFPNQQDFAIRTFGLPGGDGFLGVCFGRVITANSPASQGPDPSNWKSVLWHEFCHVVTLEKTNNRMPRWLSEGISVYEELQRDPTWGQRMTPTYRSMLLGDDLVPISQLSSAFLTAKSPLHLQLAYYQSSLAVEFLIERYGLETLQKILVDLGVGMPINESLGRYTESLENLDSEFTTFVKDRALAFGATLDWNEDALPEPEQRADWDADDWKTWLEANPNNYDGLRGLVTSQLRDRDYQSALETLQTLATHLPDEPSLLESMAEIRRQLDDSETERELLNQYVDLSADGFPQVLRLLELESAAGNWPRVLELSKHALAIQPLLPAPHQYLVDASTATDQPGLALGSLAALAVMDPVDPAKLYYQTAKAWLAEENRQQAKRYTLMALEEAPHYRDAQALLLELK